MKRILRDKDPSDGGDPKPMEEKEFQDAVLGEIKGLGKRAGNSETQMHTLLANYDQLDKATKKAMEELTTAKNSLNSLSGIEQKFARLELQLQREKRMAYGDPLQRLLSDPDKRKALSAAILNAIKVKMPETYQKALGEDSSPGSTLIDDDLASEVYDTLATYGIWNTFQTVPTGTKQTKFPVATVRPVANFILTEGGTIADDSNKAGTSVTCEMELIGCLLNVSMQLIEDGEYDVAGMLMQDFMEAFSLRLDYACLQSDGTADATNGGMTGIFAGGTAAAAAAGNITTETTDFEDWTKCLLTVDPVVLNRSARWWMHPQILIRALSVKDANGRPIFLTALEAPAPGSIGSILGYPVTPAMAAPATNAANAKIAVFGDPRGLVVGMRKQWNFVHSDDHKFAEVQRSFRGTGRVGVKIRRALAFAVLTLPAA